MKYLKLFENFNEILYIFDLDDTLVKTPSFESRTIDYLNEDISYEELLNNSLNFIGATEKDLKVDSNKKIYVEDPTKKYNITGNWVRKKDKIYMVTPHLWSFSKDSLPLKPLKLVELYNSVENKAIVTSRPTEMREEIEKILDEFRIEYPNFGLHMFNRIGTPQEWKGKTIIKIIKESKLNNVNFYDDISKTVNKVVRMVNTELPNVHIKGFKLKTEKTLSGMKKIEDTWV